jgi:hypothetical protein
VIGYDKKEISLYRHMIGGRSQMVKCGIGFMGPSDLEEAIKLHCRVTRGLSREIYAPTTDEELELILNGEGMSLGVWFEDRLICMRAVITDPARMSGILEHMGFETGRHGSAAYTEHCIVDKDFRGNNVQFLTHYAMENYISGKFDAILSTVSPKNMFSLQNILACNFVIIGLKTLYGGYMRYIMKKNFRGGAPLWTNGHLVIPSSDLERQREALADGYVGYKRIRKHSEFSILYAPMSKEPPAGYWRKSTLTA